MEARNRAGRWITGSFVALLAVSGQVPAAESGTVIAEEVIITGGQPAWQLHRDMLAAERRAYELFNQYNDEKRFEIQCSVTEGTGSRFSDQTCMPRFQLKAYQEHAQQYLESLRTAFDPRDGSRYTSVFIPQEAQIASQMAAYRAKLREIATEHPEVLQALIEYTEARGRFEGQRNLGRE
jgi:hypothetical protein